MIIALLVVFGLCLGSFINALVWRVHQLMTGKKLAASQRRELSILRGRSMCPSCRHSLAARDLVPVVSWISLKGKCRYCATPIGLWYPAVELLTASLFVVSYVFWPVNWSTDSKALFICWLAGLVILISLAVYDARWFILPNVLVYILVGLAGSFLLIRSVSSQNPASVLLGGLLGALVLSGVFFLLFQLSEGKWIGGGDVKLGLALGLIAGSLLSSLLLLFVASSLGSLVSVPLLIMGKAARQTKLPFGPLLITGLIVVVLWGSSITSWVTALHPSPVEIPGGRSCLWYILKP